MAVDENEFRQALSRFASGVTVATTRSSDGKPHGLTVSAFCSVSLSPPLVLICIERSAPSHDAFADCGAFVVNILHESQIPISQQFAMPAIDKFDLISSQPGIEGIPVFENSLATLECRLRYRHEGGDHSIFVGEVETIRVADGDPLIYFKGEYHGLK
jgi:flavin reductase (DIM6/NTAB) family NADH-FMN oxidoreductase RutF